MMRTDDIAISVRNISKKYRLYESPKHRMIEALNPFRKKYHRDFWALRNVSFEIKKGESIGIMGRKGSGKSTLLQILCGILQPSSGEVKVNGKVSAILELGAGFNTEFTGRENVYMNGALIGFTREEMDRKFDEIATFADIGDFIDQPVKIYSSGMFVRLAFSVAIHIDPDILVVDEALSVGDIRFQLKCIRKMEEFREKGNTFLLVTHSPEIIKNMCHWAIWLHDGQIFQAGSSKEVSQNYLAFMSHGILPQEQVADERERSNMFPDVGLEQEYDSDIELDDIPKNVSVSGEGGVSIKKVALFTKSPFRKANLLEGGEDVILVFAFEAETDILNPLLSFIVYDELGKSIFGTNSYVLEQKLSPFKKGDKSFAKFKFRFPRLHNGNYVVSIGIADGTQEIHIRLQVIFDAYLIQVASTDIRQKQGVLLKLDAVNLSVEPYVGHKSGLSRC